MKRVIFLTGATGLVGSHLVARILKNDATARLILLVRGKSDSDANERLSSTLRTWLSGADLSRMKRRVRVIKGDVTLSRLGLSESHYAELASEITHVIHSAASVKFHLPLDCARLINFDGTKHVLGLARSAHEAGGLQRVAYISTAYVCGNRAGTISEDELDYGQRFTNTYEQTKFESERFARAQMSKLPITIFRPGTVVGDSRSGKTTAFNVLYPPLKLIYRRAASMLPGPSCTPLDVVPVDLVTDAINHIFLKEKDGIGKTYQITAGEDKATTTGEVVDLAVDYFNGITTERHIPPVRFLPLELYRAVCGRKLLKAMQVYEPYLCVQRTFDNANTRSALQGTNIRPPQFKQYYQNILGYCLKIDWGKRLKSAA